MDIPPGDVRNDEVEAMLQLFVNAMDHQHLASITPTTYKGLPTHRPIRAVKTNYPHSIAGALGVPANIQRAVICFGF